MWFDAWEIPVESVYDRRGEAGRSQSAATMAKIEEGLEHSRVLVLCMSPMRSAGTGRSRRARRSGSRSAERRALIRGQHFKYLPRVFRDPLNKKHRLDKIEFDIPIWHFKPKRT